MNSCPTVDQVLALRERLATAVAACAEREQKLTHAGTVRAEAGKKALDDRLREEHESVAAAVSGQEAEFAARRVALAQRTELRERRIGRAYETCRTRLRVWTEGAEGRRKNKIQIGLMRAERDRDEGLAQERAAFASRRESLGAVVVEFAELEQDVRARFLGYAGCVRLTRDDVPFREADCPVDYDDQVVLSREHMAAVRSALSVFRGLGLPRLSRWLSLWLALPVVLAGLAAIGLSVWAVLPVSNPYTAWPGWILALGVALCILHVAGRRQAWPIAHSIARDLDVARTALTECGRRLVATHKARLAEIEDAYEKEVARLNRLWREPSSEEFPGRLEQGEKELKAVLARLMARHQLVSRRRRESLDEAAAAAVARLQRESEARVSAWRTEFDVRQQEVEKELHSEWQALETQWRETVLPLYEAVTAANAAADALFPDWGSGQWEQWTPPREFAETVRFGRLSVDLDALCGRLPRDARLALPGPSRFELPVCLDYPLQGSLLFETRMACGDSVFGALNNIMLRLLSIAPPGKVAFTILDPVELGQNFAGIMHLADYEESLVNRRIWTQPRQIEERLADLNEHMEKVIQMYLRNEYETIAEYNRQAGDIAEKYQFLVVADFPANFTELAARRLVSIAASGPRCGVFLLLHWDQRRQAPQDFVPDELRKNTVRLSGMGRDFVFPGRDTRGAGVVLDMPPEPGVATEFLKKVGRGSIDSNRVEVPFAHVAPVAARMWSLDTAGELRIPIGRTGATKLQYLALGKGTLQHALIAGKTGSGKSTLFHVLISNLALWCSPEEVEFYLVDFKKGVEFKCYATRQLPHARVVAIESDREFGLSVLERVDEELRRRGDLFRALGVQDLAGYRKSSGNSLPRTLLIVDEFQEFFVEEDRVSQAASLLLDRIVRQGRAFGIHVLLGSQTLGGAYTLARATLGQMTIRIALQCNEADAYLIMDDDNPAPRLLSRPGEAIYNDSAGRMEGNSPFQVVWLTDAERDRCLDTVCKLADRENADRPRPVVFEGNAPADVSANTALQRLLSAPPGAAPDTALIWLGEPNRIKGPTEAGFVRQSGNNLLAVGQSDEAVLAMLGVSLVSLAAQFPRDRLRLVLVDGSPADSAERRFLECVRETLPHALTLAEPHNLAAVTDALWQEMAQRNADPAAAAAAATTFILVHGIQRYKALRFEEDFGFSSSQDEAKPKPGTQFNDLVCEGSSVGMHLVVTCDTYSNLTRCLSRKALGEFDMRVLFQMSPNDSAGLIDSPAASQLGLHRALFHNTHQGVTELYRPYALPDKVWLEEVARGLQQRATGAP